jgi:asparagine synthase (glutamine-hydrolysing)
MCGIAGIYSFQETLSSKIIYKMISALEHRGIDDEGYLALDFETDQIYLLTGNHSKTKGLRIDEFTKTAPFFLGHRRLSVIDLSSTGHQPMSNEDGSLWIVYNGEIYNYIEIREELKSMRHCFKSGTDTEVILHAYEEWGTECLNRFNGMWAFAIWDRKKKILFCSRDRAGVKPFYYIYDGKRFCFASEIKALLEIDALSIAPNEQIVADYLFSGLIDHTEETFFKNIYQLRPGEYLLFEDKKLTIQSYWNIEPKELPFSRTDDYAEQFYELLKDSIRLRLRTDVPIGSCLSGGLDSSSIVCLANKLMFDGQTVDPKLVGERQKTFSSCFEYPIYDERKFIEYVISSTGAEKNYVFPNPKDLFKDLKRLIWHQDEPFGSTSIYAQWKVMELAKRREITVLLDGQGGDELLAGYISSFYYLFSEAWKKFDIKLLIREAKGVLKHHRSLLPSGFAVMVPKILRKLFLGLDQDRRVWAEQGFKKKYCRSISWPRKFENRLNNYLYCIYKFTVLPGLLHYEDRNSMAFSIETRLPFLDYRLVEFIFSLPTHLKLNKGMTKFILREAMKGTLPEIVRNRMDKIGFATPEEIWFRKELRDWIDMIISSKSFAERGYFDVSKVKQTFLEYCEGKQNNHFLIWRWVNLELWFRTFIDRDVSKDWSGYVFSK